MRTTFLLLLVTCALPVSVSAQEPDLLDRTATSSIKLTREKDGRPVLTTINRRFTLIDRLTRPLPGALLLLEEFRDVREPGAETGKGVVKVEAWFDSNLTNKAWTIEQEGDAGRVFDEFYVVTKQGCCTARTTNIYFNLENGQRVFSATHDLSSVIVPNTGLDRYIAFHSVEASLRPVETRDTNLKGVLQYGSYRAPLWKLAIYSKRDINVTVKLRYEDKLVESEPLMLWAVDGKKDKSSFSNFAIVLSMDSAGEIVLPIVNDEVDLTKATIPPLFRVELLK